MRNRDCKKCKKGSNLNHLACWKQMLTKAKKQESDKSTHFNILEVQGMLKPNTHNCHTWIDCMCDNCKWL